VTAASNPPPAERIVDLTRIVSAPRELVWRAWTEAEHLAKWWGPRDFTNPVCEVDARPGGLLRIVMRGPKGTAHGYDYPMSGTFQEVVPHSRLVFTAVAEDDQGRPLLRAHTTVTFEDHDKQTRVTVHAKGVGIAPIAAQMLAGMEQGWTQSLQRLSQLAPTIRG
jgi:uncharacterized protein YndB with AHSA1/START domain